jgi:predicted  nucleic acid-binding Zn-ribbon protein
MRRVFVCTACGYLFEDITSAEDLPEQCPNCEATRDKFVEYDRRLETWIRKAVAQHVLYPDEEGANLRSPNSSLSTHIRFAVVGAVRARR